jgi:hypothetical protein
MTKSSVSSLVNKAGIMKLADGLTTVFYGLKVENNHFVYYTAKGIRDILIMKKNTFTDNETVLQNNNFIAKVPCDQIAELVRLNKSISSN